MVSVATSYTTQRVKQYAWMQREGSSVLEPEAGILEDEDKKIVPASAVHSAEGDVRC